jgi:ABC-type oligopeptide transport system substrate-binding subunit
LISKKFKKLSILLFSLMPAFVSLTASAAPPLTAGAHTLNVRLIGEPETLDWNKAHTTVETFILTNLMEGLVGFDSNMQVAPALADSWKVSSD